MHASNDTRPRVGVSACLLGHAVRYDGTARPDRWLMETLARHAELVPLCPEAGAGLGVPRPPVQLVQTPVGLRVLGVERQELDVTEALEAWCRRMDPLLADLTAVVLKSRSPSCGVGSTPVRDTRRHLLDTGDGLLARHVRRRHPGVLLLDELQLVHPNCRQALLDATQIE